MTTNSEILGRIKRAKANYDKITHITEKKNLSHQDKFKISLCRHFVQFANLKKMKLIELSKLIGLPKTRLSEITNYKINKFTVDQLIKNLELLSQHDSKVSAYLDLLQEAAMVPFISSSESRKLRREIAKTSKAARVYA